MRVAFLNIPARGHTNPTFAVVAELVGRGHVVDYWSFDQFRAEIERAGGRFRAYPDVGEYEERQRAGNIFWLARVLLEATEKVLPTLLAELGTTRPDVVVHDSLAAWAAFAARALGIPAVASISTFVIDRRVVSRDPSLLLYGARQALGGWRDYLAFRRHARRIARRHGLPAPAFGGLFASLEALNIVYTSRELQPQGGRFDESFIFVGPSLRDEDPGAFPLERVDGCVYVSLGTLFNEHPEFFRAAIRGLARADRPLVVAVGDDVDPDSLGPVPANAIVRHVVPQLAVLRRCAAFVTHGGMNSVNEALASGVPLVVHPLVHDQLIVARRVAALGAGTILRRPDPPAIGRAVEAVLADPRYRTAAARLGEALRAGGGARRAADEIEKYAVTSARARTS